MSETTSEGVLLTIELKRSLRGQRPWVELTLEGADTRLRIEANMDDEEAAQMVRALPRSGTMRYVTVVPETCPCCGGKYP